jgi:hypothetical protein
MLLPRIDLTGQEFGRLRVERFACYPPNKPSAAQWWCTCECGSRGLKVFGFNLKNGNTNSCGCLKVERTSAANSTHRLSGTNAYGQYSAMLARCLSPTNKRFRLYGARGIIVDPAWLGVGGFERFLSDMGPRPSVKHSIERVDNDGPYSSENCRWATQSEQCNNRRGNVIVEYEGKKQTLTQLCRRLKIPHGRTQSRLRRGQSLLEAIDAADQRSTRGRRLVETKAR